MSYIKNRTWVGGDSPTAGEFNNFEQGIYNADRKAGTVLFPTVSGYALTVDDSDYVMTASDAFIIAIGSEATGGNVTLNINSGGAYEITDMQYNNISTLPIGAYLLRWTGAVYRLIGMLTNQNTGTGDDVSFNTVNGRSVASDGSKLDGIEANADVTDAVNVGSSMAGVSAVSLADTDTLPLNDASDGSKLKKIAWANIKSTVKTWIEATLFSLVYGAIFKQGNNISDITSNSYTLVIADNGKYIRWDGTANGTITIPPNSSVAFPTGTEITIVNLDTAYTLTIAEGSGVTINSKDGNDTIDAQYGAVSLKKVATDTWDMIGATA